MTQEIESFSITSQDMSAAIEEATRDVFSTMLGMKILSSEMLPPPQTAVASSSGIFSLIGMAGTWAGTAGLVCSSDLACRMSAGFLMSEFSCVNEEVLDAVAEITNMIGGNIKNMMEQKVGDMRLSTPTVISGQNLQAHGARSNRWTVVRFHCDAGELFVQLCLTPNPADGESKSQPGFHFPQLVAPI